MWRLKIAEGNGPYLCSTSNFVGRQFWEWDPSDGTLEEQKAFERAREDYRNNGKKGVHASADLFMRMQVMIMIVMLNFS